MDRLLTIKEAAQRLGVSDESLYVLARQGRFPIVRIGRSIRVDPEKLQAWIEQGGTSHTA
ncbi:MAG: helix-turn-helix domain-containing protein [Alicyclobacillus sp.]|nr:helix-turn-helix domain-containing protein [Alicyclobacillus sp.]